jgi:hypothetical protein
MPELARDMRHVQTGEQDEFMNDHAVVIVDAKGRITLAKRSLVPSDPWSLASGTAAALGAVSWAK